MAAAVVPATQEQVRASLQDAQAFEAFAPSVNAAVVRRWLWLRTLLGERGTWAGFGMLDMKANERADRSAELWAQAVTALERGQAELAPTSKDGGRTLALGVVVRGTLPATLQAWPIVPLVVLAVAAVGTWLLVDAWLSARTIEAEAAKLHAQNQAAVTAAIARAKTPADAKMLADALAKANAAVKAPSTGILDRIAQGIGSAFEAAGEAAAKSGTEIAIGVALLAWALSRRGRR
jgi:hypothetical protein